MTTESAPFEEKSLLRFITCGSVDDGKSTLIGRLLYDSKMVFDDQLKTLEADSRKHGTQGERLDLALLVDGLAAEREQGITIDVAYRYFATPKRKFIIADTPGHVQYTRNMVTGASTANVALILVDARKGVLEQTRRHASIATLLALPRAIFCVNKMDLVDFSETRFMEICDEIRDALSKLDPIEASFIPISALEGDNVVDRSQRMPWYAGASLLEHLETMPAGNHFRPESLRFPVQYVLKPEDDGRGRRYLGRVADGVVRPGDHVVAHPGGQQAVVTGVETSEGPLELAFPPLSVGITLDREIDVSRGSMLVPADSGPRLERSFDVNICWLGDRPVRSGDRFLARHGATETQCIIGALHHRLDMETLEPLEAPAELRTNDVARIELRTAATLVLDHYRDCRGTGSLILIDPTTHITVGAAMVVPREESAEKAASF